MVTWTPRISLGTLTGWRFAGTARFVVVVAVALVSEAAFFEPPPARTKPVRVINATRAASTASATIRRRRIRLRFSSRRRLRRSSSSAWMDSPFSTFPQGA